MKRPLIRFLLVLAGLGGGWLPSCTSGWLLPAREAVVDGVTNFVAETVFNVLDRWIDLGEPEA